MRKLLILLGALFLWSSQCVFAQVTGKVTDANGAPIPGASIKIKGTNKGTTTNVDGTFTLDASDAVQLEVSSVGYRGQTISASPGQSLSVSLISEAKNISEVVLTALGVRREKRSLGYSTSQVNGDDLNAGGVVNPIAALQGKVSGVNITTGSNSPGSSTRIVLRGGSSLVGSNQPLMIVDGVPFNNSNFFPDKGVNNSLNNQVDYGNRGNDLNPEDIESISVLKGPAATALYGQNASNGALIITTKKGSRSIGGKKYVVTLNTSYSRQSVLKLPDLQNSFGQGDADAVADDRRENFSWGLPFDGHLRPWGQIINGLQQVKPYKALPDNVKDFFDLGWTWDNNVSLSGGDAKNTFYLSLSSLTNEGIVPTSRYNKYGIRLNVSSEFSQKLTGNASVYYSKIKSRLPNTGQSDGSFLENIYQTPRDISIVDQKDYYNPYNSINLKTDSGTYYGYYGAYASNPYFGLDNYKNYNYVDRLSGSYTLEFKPFKGVSILNRFGMDAYSDRRVQKWNKYGPNFSFNSFSEDFYEQPYSGGPKGGYQGKYSENNFNYNQFNNDLIASYSTTGTGDFGFKGLLGFNINSIRLEELYAATNDAGIATDNPDLMSLEETIGPIDAYNVLTLNRTVGIYAGVDLSYKNYLFLNLSGRNDHSSTLPTKNNSYFYPSASLAFVFTDLISGKIKDNFLNYGKLRLSYAAVGHDAPAYRLTNVYNKTVIDNGYGTTTFPFGGTLPGYTYGGSEFDRQTNPDLKPERTTSIEGGMEFSFFKDRLGIDFSLFANKSKDQIISAPVAPASGFTSQVLNVGEVTNRGGEVLVRGTPVSTRNFKWEASATFTRLWNKVRSLNAGTDLITLGGFSDMTVVAAVGKPYGTFYSIDQQTTPGGQVIVDSSNGLPLPTTNPVFGGSYLPDWTGSFRSSFKYKDLTLSFLVDTKQGGFFFSRTKDLLGFVGSSEETVKNNREDYVYPNSVYVDYKGDYVANTTPFHPYTYFTDAGKGIQPGRNIVDASYVKLREVSLSYDVPSSILKRTKYIGGATLSLFANNLFIWTPDENKYADPELNSEGSSNLQGFQYAAVPSVRNYGINLKVVF